MTISLKNKIINYYKSYYKDSLGIPNWEQLTNKQLDEDRDEVLRIEYLEDLLGKFKNKNILDIGCGTGGFVIASCLQGANTFGIEPDQNALEICKLKKNEQKLSNCKFYEALAEKLPFKDKKFDVVHSLTVLEHVNNVEKSISEMVRVAKIGGLIYIKCPNYLSFYEGHYKIFWLPLFPKYFAKKYLKLRKRPVEFIDSINYLTPGLITRIMKNNNLNYRFIFHKIERHGGLINLLIYFYQKIFRISQNIEVIITK